MSLESVNNPGDQEAKFSAANLDLDDAPAPSDKVISENKLIECVREDGILERVEAREWRPEGWMPDATEDVSVIVVPGLGETLGAVDEWGQTIARVGQERVLALKHPQVAPPKESESLEDRAAKFSAIHRDRGERVRAVQGELGMKRLDLVAHSQGCIDAVVAAYMSVQDGTNSVRDLILFNPGGVSHKDDQNTTALTIRLALRGLGEATELAARAVVHPKSLRKFIGNASETAWDVARHPKLTIEQTRAIASTDMTEILRYLKDQGVGVVIAAGVGDNVFHMGDMQNALTSKEVDGFYSLSGGHNQNEIDPETMGKLVVEIQKGRAKQRASRAERGSSVAE